MNTFFTDGTKTNPYIDYDKLQSTTIDLLRFPLAIMVIFIHMLPPVVGVDGADFPVLSGSGILNITEITLSYVIPFIAVPCFFLISGYLFFANFQKWSFEGYKSKLRSRIKTLVLPYILWNLVPFLIVLGKMTFRVVVRGKPSDELISMLSKDIWHIFYDTYHWDAGVSWLGEKLYLAGPFDLPLWFLRDLIVVTLFTPVIYFMIRKFKIYFIALLALAFVSGVWILLPGFGITAFFFFSLGTYMALNKINIVQFVHKYKYLIVPLFLLQLCLKVYFYGGNTTISPSIAMPLIYFCTFFICFGVFFAFYVASYCALKFKARPNKLLVSSCFFIYALHDLYMPGIGRLLDTVRSYTAKLIPIDNAWGELLAYLLIPFLTAAVCILILQGLRRIAPRFAAVISGNRSLPNPLVRKPDLSA